jgi:catechol 2,3-dioxygenase-like lactoylglutathione lyase family enzyme
MEIIELRVLTHRLDKQRAFYTDTLGLALLAETAEMIAIEAGATRLIFTRAPDGEIPYYHFAFNIPENRLPQAKGWLKQRTALLTQDGEDQFIGQTWESEQVYFTDPAGNIAELIARHTLPNSTDAPFGPRSILNVSEIGLPVDDVVGTVDGLNAALGTGRYKDGHETFMPVGDERGLFIVTKRGRPWFPTDHGATAHQTAITIRGTRSTEYHVPNAPYHIAVVTGADAAQES